MPSSEKAKKKILKENYFDVFLEGFVCLVIYWQEQRGTRRGQKGGRLESGSGSSCT